MGRQPSNRNESRERNTLGRNRNPRRTNESITFRLDSKLLDHVRKEAYHKDVSLNTIVSHIIKDHALWHSNAARAGFISVRKVLVTKLLEKYGEDEIKDVARYVAEKSSKDMLLFLRNTYDVDAAIDVLETWLKVSGYHYDHSTERITSNTETGYREERAGFGATIHSFIIQHDMGIRWSTYLSELYNHICKGFGIIMMSRDMSESTVQLVIKIYDSGNLKKQRIHGASRYEDALT